MPVATASGCAVVMSIVADASAITEPMAWIGRTTASHVLDARERQANSLEMLSRTLSRFSLSPLTSCRSRRRSARRAQDQPFVLRPSFNLRVRNRADQVLIHCNRHTKESSRNRCPVRTAALILAVEQVFQFLLQVSGAAVLFRGLEGIHGWTVVSPEIFQQL